MGRRELAWKIFIGGLGVLAVIIPGSIELPYNGLPVSIPEFVILIVWAASVAVFPWHQKRKAALAAAAALIAFILIDFSSYLLYPAGWQVCVKRVYKPETLANECEPSAWSRGVEYSFLVREIDYDEKNMPLYFMNEREFHFHAEGSPDRHDMPYEIKAQAYFNPVEETEAVVKVNMEGARLMVNGEPRELSEDRVEEIKLPAGKISEVVLFYSGHRQEADQIRFETGALPFINRNGAASWQAGLGLLKGAGWIALAVLTSLAVWSAGKFLSGLNTGGRQAVLVSASAAAVYFLVDEPMPEVLAIIMVSIGLATVFMSRGDMKKVAIAASLLLLAISFRQVDMAMDFEELILLPGGDDQLTHEGLARTVMKSRTWHEFWEADTPAVFYFQPLHRYILGLEHRILGDSLAGPIMVQVWLMGMAVLAAIWAVATVGGLRGALIFGLMFFAAQTGTDNNWLNLAMLPYQEAVALPLFVMGVSGIIWCVWNGGRQGRLMLATGILWGLAVGVRTNLAPAAMAIGVPAIWWLYRRNFKNVWLMGLGFTVPLLTIVLRNVYIAGQAKLFTTSIIPNLIDNLRIYFPGQAGPSDYKFSQVLGILGESFAGRQGELARLLWQNALTHYVGEEMFWRLAWSVGLIAGAGGLVLLPGRKKILVAVMVILALLPMVFGSLFLHRAVAVRTQSNVVAALLLSVMANLAIPWFLTIIQAARIRITAKEAKTSWEGMSRQARRRGSE